MLPFNGQPIISYPIKVALPIPRVLLVFKQYTHTGLQAAVESGIFDLVVVSTDDEEIAEVT